MDDEELNEVRRLLDWIAVVVESVVVTCVVVLIAVAMRIWK